MDLFGLVESDLHRPVFGNRDLTQYLAEVDAIAAFLQKA